MSNDLTKPGDIVSTTWAERALLDAWGAIEPRPYVNKAQDAQGELPALIDFTILDLRIGLEVWANFVTAFVSHRLYCTDAFAGRVFQEMSEEPSDSLSLAEFVRSLSDNYPTILRNVPRDDPRAPDTPQEVIADEQWQAERKHGADGSRAGYAGTIAAIAFPIVAIIVWWAFFRH